MLLRVGLPSGLQYKKPRNGDFCPEFELTEATTLQRIRGFGDDALYSIHRRFTLHYIKRDATLLKGTAAKRE